MCHKIGMPPMFVIGLGKSDSCVLNLLPSPPASMTAFIPLCYCEEAKICGVATHYLETCNLPPNVATIVIADQK